MESLIGNVVNAAAETLTDTLSSTLKGASTTGSSVTGANPQWPASSPYKQYAYAENVSIPNVAGKLRGGKVRFVQNGKTYLDNALFFDSVPLQHAIVRVHGNGQEKIALFIDPTCPYSKRLEQEVNKLNNVTIYTIMAPVLKANAKRSKPLIDHIYCASSNQARARAYDNYMLNGIEPFATAGCPQVAARLLKSIDGVRDREGRLYSEFTPTVIFANDIAMSGYLPLADIKENMALKTTPQ
jgi:hypothetical protein